MPTLLQALAHGPLAHECCSTGSTSCAGREWAALPAAQVLQQPQAWGAAWSSSATAAVPEDPPTSATGGGDAVSSSHGTDVTATIPVQALVSPTALQAGQPSILCLACLTSGPHWQVATPSVPACTPTVLSRGPCCLMASHLAGNTLSIYCRSQPLCMIALHTSSIHPEQPALQVTLDLPTHLPAPASGLIAALLCLQEAITDSELTPRQVVERLDKFIVGQVSTLPVSLLLSGGSMLMSFRRPALPASGDACSLLVSLE